MKSGLVEIHHVAPATPGGTRITHGGACANARVKSCLTSDPGIAPSNHLVKRPSQIEVFLSQSPLAVRNQSKSDLVPANIDIRVMPGRFRFLRDLIHEFHRFNEIHKFEHPNDVLVVQFPFIERAECVTDLFVGEKSHTSLKIGITRMAMPGE